MNYSQSIEYLFSLQRMGARLGTESVTELLDRIGNPHRSFPSVLVAGTNGKGSTAAFLASILQEAGVRLGLYTSPHLVRFEERIRVNGGSIPPEALASLTTQLRAASRGMVPGPGGQEPPSFFETATALAFKFFQEQQVELAILEVGMGGRLDATRVANAGTCLFASIDLDHRQQLGYSLREVASEKACILPPGGLALTMPQPPEVEEVLSAAAAAQGTKLVPADSIWRIHRGSDGRLEIISGLEDGRKIDKIQLSLAGRHQCANATLATACATSMPAFRERVTDSAIRDGLAKTNWPGRCQRVDGKPLVLLDGAHNPAAAQALRYVLMEEFVSRDRPLVLVFGAMQDKDLEGMMERLFPLAKRIFLAQAQTPRAADPMVLESLGRRFNPALVRSPNLSAALSAAREEAGPDGVVCVCGSLYLVGDFLSLLEGTQPRTRQAL